MGDPARHTDRPADTPSEVFHPREILVPIASREDLSAMKRAAGRDHDLEDVALLESLSEEA
jgi:hypothetical protein